VYTLNQKTSDRSDNYQAGWPIQDDEAGAGRPRAVTAVPPPSPTRWMTMDEIDDGWFLPEETASEPISAVAAEASAPVAAAGASAPVVNAETTAEPASAASAPVAAAGAPTAAPGPVDLNAATLDELCQVPGVGRTRAQRILERRTARGRFASVDDLGAVKGIGGKTLEQLRPHFRV
jgi:competence ComEA-like helix-hairpin-helix protein